MLDRITGNHIHFPGQHKDEEVKIVFRRSIFFLIMPYILNLVLLIILLVSAAILPNNITILQDPFIGAIFNFIITLIILFILFTAFLTWTHYYLDAYIVTNQRVLTIDQIDFFHRKVSEADIGNVQDIEVVVKGFFSNILNFGDIRIQTAGADQKTLFFDNVPYPYKAKDIILKFAEANRTVELHMSQIKQKLIQIHKIKILTIQSPKLIAPILGLFLFIPHFAFASFQSVEINEINYIGYTDWKDNTPGSADEFIELKNPNPSTPISLSGWTLRIFSGAGDKTIVLSGSITDYVVIRRIASSQTSLPPIDKVINITSSNFGSLSNTAGAYIELRNNLGVTIDAVNFRDKWPQATTNTQSLHKVSNLVWEAKTQSPLNITPVPNSPTPTPTPTPEPEKINYSGVIISEIYPNPAEGGKEFVELYNTTDKDIDLANWKLDDIPSGGSTIQTLSGIIPAKRFLVLEDGGALKIGLNNDQDSVILYDPNGIIQSQVDYTMKDSQKGSSYIWIDENWLWNPNPSPNTVNTAPASDSVIITPITTTPVLPIPITPQLPKHSIGSIIISELYPYPSSGEEFIELYNTTEQDIDLTGWKIADLAKSYILSGIILAKSYQLYNQSEITIALNNTSETVTLTDNYNQIQSNTSYTKAYKGLSYIPVLQTWSWTQTLTPNAPNIFTENPNSENSKTYTKIENIENLSQITDGEFIELEGQVIIPAGDLVDTSFYVIKENRIVKVYDRQKRFPILNSGSIVRVKAEWHNTDTQQYLKTISPDNIELISEQTITIQSETKKELEITDWGKIISVSGVIDTNTKTKLVINNKNQDIAVKLYANKIIKPKMKKGDIVTLIGFIEVYDGEIRLIPWDNKQIKVTPIIKKASANSIKLNTISEIDNNSSNLISTTNTEYRGLDEYQIPGVPETKPQNSNGIQEFMSKYGLFSLAIILNLSWWGYWIRLRYRII